MQSTSQLEVELAAAREPTVAPAVLIDAQNALAWALRGSNPARAHQLAKEARKLAQHHGHKLGQARAARTMAMTVRSNDELRHMFQLAEEAKQLFDETGDGPGRAGSRDFLATLHEYTGDLAGGLELALDALNIARELNDKTRQGYALSSVGGILAASGEYDAAVARLKEALEFFEETENQDGIGTICSRLCKVLKEAGKPEQALSYAKKCRDIAELTQQDYMHWSAFMLTADIEASIGNTNAAEKLYQSALNALSEEPIRDVIGAETKVALAKLLIQRGALDEAERELSGTLASIAGNQVSILLETAANEVFADLRERQGQLSEALRHLRKVHILREEISKRDARNKLAQIDVHSAMERAKKDAETHKLRFAELRNTQSKVVEAEKMAILGKLAAGTAHELNTPLGVLRNNTQLTATATERLSALVRNDTPNADKARRLTAVLDTCCKTSSEAVERIATIAQSFKRFTQLDQAEVRSFDVREGIDSALSLLEPTTSEEITWQRKFQQVPNIEVWPRELNHAFFTVLQNAAQALDGPGIVTVETFTTEHHVVVRVEDTGRGMSEGQLARLFDIAWSEDGTRTKMRLGLSAAYATVQKHGGKLEVSSKPGAGTRVTFRLPISKLSPQQLGTLKPS